ncbi:MAG: NAD(P)-dependent oxidoreductase [Bacillales bacterium]|nr:NAD(P)-dependent oxidoreductase [Bacillales bacterium]
MRIGFIGLGIMGLPMAENVSKKYPLIGYDVVKKEATFPIVNSIKELVDNSDVIISMVPKNEHVISVYNEVIKYVRPGMICIDMSTISPSVNQIIALELEKIEVKMLDCPVVKSQPAAISATLGIYVGGDKEVYMKVKDILSCMGSNIIYMGSHGKGLTMKILHNMLVGQIQNSVNEMMFMASELELDLNDVVQAISYGGGQNFYLDTKANNIINDAYKTAFSVENMNKDIHLAKDIADNYDLNLTGLNNVCRIYEEAMEKGLAKEDFSITYKVVSKEN